VVFASRQQQNVLFDLRGATLRISSNMPGSPTQLNQRFIWKFMLTS
jgi:hypothetical protein